MCVYISFVYIGSDPQTYWKKNKVISRTEKISHQSIEAPWLARACLSPDVGLRNSGLAKFTSHPTPHLCLSIPSADALGGGGPWGLRQE